MLDYIPVVNILEFLKKKFKESKTPKKVRQLVLSQVLTLRDIYGELVPKDEITKIFQQQLSIVKTGFKTPPVDIEEFILSPEYMDLRGIIRPAILEFLINLHRNSPECYEVVIGGATGIGKTFSACVSMAYDLYRLSCLYSPQVQYGIAPGSEIVFSFQSVNKDKALRNFEEFKSLLSNSHYFSEVYKFKSKKDKLIFNNNIVVKVFTAKDTAAISENIFDAFIDEANWMKVIKGSKQAQPGSDVYDQATQLYLAIKDRIQNRFKDFKSGILPGKIYLVSSANYEDDFISRKEEEAKKNKSIYVFHKALWEVKPMELSGKTFWVQLPTENQEGKILDKEPLIKSSDVIEVPVEFKQSFKENLIDSIRNIAGIPIARTISFIPATSIDQAVSLYRRYYQNRKFFSKEYIKASDLKNIEAILNTKFIQMLGNLYTFGMHIDMSKNQDSMGLAIGCVPGVRLINPRRIIDPTTNKTTLVHDGEVPVYVFPGLLQVRPSPEDEIKADEVFNMIILLKRLIPKLAWVSFDRYFSTSVMQNLKKHSIKTFTQSVVSSNAPYDEFRNAAVSGRVAWPANKTFKEEIKYLIQDSITGKVDHDPFHSKDICDCVAAVCYVFSKNPKVWCRDTQIKGLTKLQSGVLKEEQTQVKIERKSVRRPSVRK